MFAALHENNNCHRQGLDSAVISRKQISKDVKMLLIGLNVLFGKCACLSYCIFLQ